MTGRGASTDEGSTTLTVHGCAEGSGVVELRTSPDDTLLASITITVEGDGPPPPPDPIDTATPTPGPPPTLPTGSISVSSAEIATGQTTTVTAEWSPTATETKITISNSTVLGSSSQCSGVGNLLDQTTLTLWGCARGTAVVELRTVDGNKTLASAVVFVRKTPEVTAWSRIGYRWFTLDWSADPDFVDFRLEYVTAGASWQSLGTNATSVPSAIIDSVTTQSLVKLVVADIRGVPHGSLSITIRVIGTTADGFEATSMPFHGISRGDQPRGLGHLHDHTMRYDLSQLATSTEAELAGWLESLSPDAARAWASIEPLLGLYSCQGHCPRNTDGDVVIVKIGDSSECGGTGFVACMDVARDIDDRLVGNRIMMFGGEPYWGSQHYEWTRDPSMHGKKVDPTRDVLYIYLDRVVYHEFGHAYGLDDRRGEASYRGLMGDWIDVNTVIMADDRQALNDIYSAHTRNESW